MTTRAHDVIDIVGVDGDLHTVVLAMVEDRDWGANGALLPDLEAKLNTYLSYVLDGGLERDHPELRGSPVRIELHCAHVTGDRELEFLALAEDLHLRPNGLELQWKSLAEPT
jgi:hypothetical protein